MQTKKKNVKRTKPLNSLFSNSIHLADVSVKHRQSKHDTQQKKSLIWTNKKKTESNKQIKQIDIRAQRKS